MASAPSAEERRSHVIRRLSMGAHPDITSTLRDTDAAIARALDLSTPPPTPLAVAVPTDYDTGRNLQAIAEPIAWWIKRMTSPDRLIEERLTWFWHDHFATSVAKVHVPYLMWTQHLTLRANATGNFATMLKAVAKDPAMVLYLDGIKNAAAERNENFGRECLELFTMGRDGGYSQDDVVAASRAFTGWVVVLPGRVADRAGAPWTSLFVPRRHDAGMKTLLGTTAALDMDTALDVVLDHPSTAHFVATKLFRELVGLEPSDATVKQLATTFRHDYEIMPLVEAIVHDDAFTSDDAVRAKYRTPLEKLVAILQATGTDGVRVSGPGRKAAAGTLPAALRTMNYLPFLPPNVGGYPKGARLIGPGNLVHAFDLLQAVGSPPTTTTPVDELFARFGVFDISDTSRRVVHTQRDPAMQLALVVTSPEVTLT